MKRIWILCLIFLVALGMAACDIRTVDEMYCLPERPEEDRKLQTAINSAMTGMTYCAPLAGEHQQPVQTADLDGDSEKEYLVYTKGTSDYPLCILVFKEIDGEFVLLDSIESIGSAFDQVEYVQMDENAGVEIVVGSQISDQLLRVVTIYTLTDNGIEQILSANYSKFLSVDLNADGFRELFVLKPGQMSDANGVAELYAVRDGAMERYNEASLSVPADKLKRVVVGKLHDLPVAVYTAGAVGDSALITDVFTIVDDQLVNISFSNESGTSVNTLRSYYVYADDIDNDGVVELPDLNRMFPLSRDETNQENHWIRWYAMRSDGGEVSKVYTYHNFIGGWYLELDGAWAQRLTVSRQGSDVNLHLWDRTYNNADSLVTISALTGSNREEQVRSDSYIVLLKTDSAIYAAKLGPAAERIDLTDDILIRSFHLIYQDWKSGEI